MRFPRFIIHGLLDYAMLGATGPVPPVQGDTSSPPFERDLEERANRPTNHHINLQAPPPSAIADLPTLPTSVSEPIINLTTNLTAAKIFEFRVPHSTIALHVFTANLIDGQVLGNALLAMHGWLNDEIASYGDSTLADRKDDPFIWKPDGPPRILPKPWLGHSTLPVSLTAQSAPREYMTYSVLLIAVEGLYLCLPSVGRDFGAKFEIWDWRNQAMWGYGELRGL